MRILLGIVSFALSAASVLAANSCSVSGVAGTCISTSSCASSGGTSTPGFCPNDPNDVRCCTRASSGGQSCRTNDGRSGTCKSTSDCSGTSVPGFCPGASNIQCCVSGGGSGGQSCSTNDGRSGTCKSTSDCSGTSVPGFCPGASNIQCCVSGGGSGGQSCSTNDGRSGTCKSTSTCSGTSVPGFCPGASNIQCCVTGDAPKPPSGPFDADKVIAAARRRIGLPYSWGGGHGSQPGPSYGTCSGYSGPAPCLATKTFGFDCSGLVRDAIFGGTGIDLGRSGNTDSQLADRHATVIDYSQRQAGDIEFFGPRGATTHVILYIGKNSAGQDMMIEAQKTGTNVHEVPLRVGGIWVRVR
ncbi:hypothetical protein BGZ75_001530 [Mortierella antarctica]|nr:hypothetical protein BGZ75_001530 [Mortierella antarctica]